jgi:hypothetical protein
VLLDQIAQASAKIASTRSRLKKIELLTSILVQHRPDEVPIAVAYLSGVLPPGIDRGWVGSSQGSAVDLQAALAPDSAAAIE